MVSDIIIPKNNETEFAEIASKLGYKKLYFLYDFDGYNEEKIQKKFEAIENKKINIETGFLVNQKNLGKAAKKSRFLVVKSSEKDRFFIESKKIKLIYGFEELYKKDYLHQRASGLNHVLCELARKNKVEVGFSYSSIINSKNNALLMGRIMQNLGLCRKYKVNIAVASFSSNPFDLRHHHDIASLFKLLGTDAKNNF